VVGHFHYVLSLGAVYAMFAAFYYWIGKISGYQYTELWGVVHFVIFTIAINIVFFPMVRPEGSTQLRDLPRSYLSVGNLEMFMRLAAVCPNKLRLVIAGLKWLRSGGLFLCGTGLRTGLHA
jgi:heme/copper-type cytochrome/quinol oxidase subunit 1